MLESRVRELVRAGLCAPSRHGKRYAFSFQDVVVLRAAQGLLENRVPLSRVRRALSTLAEELPRDRPLSGLRIYADGRQVVARDGAAAWHPETGQTVLNFEVDELEVDPSPAGRWRWPERTTSSSADSRSRTWSPRPP
jgi:hypothetical protein